MSEAQARVDEEITGQILSLCALRVRRNTFSPIFRLPPETLSAIFIHGACNYHKNPGFSDSYHREVPSWVNVSYVCRHWRDVALNCPTLWSYHFTVSLRWTKELLARSNPVSFKIRVWYGYKSQAFWSGLLEELVTHLDRIQELQLNLPALLLPEKISLNAPRLQSFRITVDVTSPHARGWSPVLLGGDTPALCTLDLSGCGLPWHSLALRGLTTLSLNHVPPRSKLNIVEFRAALNRMQSLTSLSLTDALGGARDFILKEDFHAFPKVNLPHLTRLLVAAPLSAVVALLSCIDVPLKAQVKLDFRSEEGSIIGDYALISRLFVQKFCTPEDQASSRLPIRSLSIECSSFGLQLSFSPLERDFCHLPMSIEQWDCNIPLKIALTMDWLTTPSNRDEYRDSIISYLCCSIPLADVQSLCVTGPPFSLTFWKKLFGHLQGLRYIKLSYGYMPDLASLLSSTAHKPTEGPTIHSFVPALEEMELFNITFLSNKELPEPAIFQSWFVSALSSREGLLDRLTVTQCPGWAEPAVDDAQSGMEGSINNSDSEDNSNLEDDSDLEVSYSDLEVSYSDLEVL